MELIIFIILIYVIYTKYNKLNNPAFLLISALKNQQFSNIQTLTNNQNISLIKADSHGENFLFAIKKNLQFISVNDIEFINNYSKKLHIHNCIVITNPNLIPEAGLTKLKNYNIEIWTLQKLESLAKPSEKPQKILKTSNISDDTCKIDSSSFDPIQDGEKKSHSIFGGIFEKPDKL